MALVVEGVGCNKVIGGGDWSSSRSSRGFQQLRVRQEAEAPSPVSQGHTVAQPSSSLRMEEDLTRAAACEEEDEPKPNVSEAGATLAEGQMEVDPDEGALVKPVSSPERHDDDSSKLGATNGTSHQEGPGDMGGGGGPEQDAEPEKASARDNPEAGQAEDMERDSKKKSSRGDRDRDRDRASHRDRSDKKDSKSGRDRDRSRDRRDGVDGKRDRKEKERRDRERCSRSRSRDKQKSSRCSRCVWGRGGRGGGSRDNGKCGRCWRMGRQLWCIGWVPWRLCGRENMCMWVRG